MRLRNDLVKMLEDFSQGPEAPWGPFESGGDLSLVASFLWLL